MNKRPFSHEPPNGGSDQRLVPLPLMFLAFWEALQMRHQSTAAAHRNLIAIWKLGDQMPGYGCSPKPTAKGVPHGWTLGNLRRFKPDMTPRIARKRNVAVELPPPGSSASKLDSPGG